MELYVPSLISASLAFVIILACFVLRPPIIVIGIISLIALFISAYVHATMYQVDYRNFIFDSSIQTHATIILVFSMIVFAIGYLLMLPSGTPVKKLIGTAPLFSTPTLDKYGTKKPSEPSILDYWFGNSKEQPRPEDQNRNRAYSDRGFDRELRRLLGSF